MKDIYRKTFDEKTATGLKIKENEVSVGGIILSYEHSQDCCENVYADFGVLEYYKDKIPHLIKEISIATVEGMGFLLRLKDDYNIELKILINCYNEQNGYYSDDLNLIVNDNGVVTKYSLRESGCIQDMIY